MPLPRAARRAGRRRAAADRRPRHRRRRCRQRRAARLEHLAPRPPSGGADRAPNAVASCRSRARPRRSTPAARAGRTRSAPICRACSTLVGDFVQVGPDGRRAKASSTSRSPARCASSTIRRARSTSSPTAIGGGARPQARDPGHLSAVADAVALPARRPHRPACATPTWSRVTADDMFITVGGRGEAGAGRHQPADADVQRQGSAAEAMDGDRPAGLRHHGRGLQSRHHQSRPDPSLFKIDYERSHCSRRRGRRASARRRPQAHGTARKRFTALAAAARASPFWPQRSARIGAVLPRHASMRLTVTTWNINSVRLRIDLVAKFIKAVRPDVLCLQETKCPDDKFPLKRFKRLGYEHVALNGQKGYHGVVVLSRLPFEAFDVQSFCGKTDCRHVSAVLGERAGLRDPITLHNFYVPAGGDDPGSAGQSEIRPQARVPRRDARLRRAAAAAASARDPGRRSQRRAARARRLEPQADAARWSRTRRSNARSSPPRRTAGGWVDAMRELVPEPAKLYTWWSYRVARLGRPPTRAAGSITSGSRRRSPTASPASTIAKDIARLGAAVRPRAGDGDASSSRRRRAFDVGARSTRGFATSASPASAARTVGEIEPCALGARGEMSRSRCAASG